MTIAVLPVLRLVCDAACLPDEAAEQRMVTTGTDEACHEPAAGHHQTPRDSGALPDDCSHESRASVPVLRARVKPVVPTASVEAQLTLVPMPFLSTVGALTVHALGECSDALDRPPARPFLALRI